MQTLPLTSNLAIELVLLFNCLVLDNSSCVSHLERSLTRLLNSSSCVTVSSFRPSTALNVWQRISHLIRSLIIFDVDLSVQEATLIAAISTTAAVRDQVVEGKEVADSCRSLCEKASKVSRNDELKVLDIFFPLQSLELGFDHAEDVFKLNSLVLSLKASPSELKQVEITTVFGREGLKSVAPLSTYMTCLVDKVKGKGSRVQANINRLARQEDIPKCIRVECLLLKGFNWIEQGLNQLALTTFCKVLTIDPGNIKAVIGTRQAFGSMGKISCEIESLELIINLIQTQNKSKYSGYTSCLLALLSPCKANTLLEFLQLLAYKRLKFGDYSGAANSYLTCLSQPGSTPGGDVCVQELRLGAAVALLLADQPQDSLVITQYMESVVSRKRKIGVDSFEFIFCLINGQIYYKMEQFARSLHFLDKALQSCYLTENPANKLQRLNDTKNKETTDKQGEKLRYQIIIRSRLYVEKCRVYKAMGDTHSYSQCIDAALSLHPTQHLIDLYKRDLPTRSNGSNIDRLNQGVARVEELLQKENDGVKGNRMTDDSLEDLCLELLLPDNQDVEN